MKTQLLQNERLIKKGGANLQRGLETVGGNLYLTNIHLIHEPHSFNLQTEPAVIGLSAVKSIRPDWTKLLGVIPAFPNALVITTEEREYRITVFNREKWLESINLVSTSK